MSIVRTYSQCSMLNAVFFQKNGTLPETVLSMLFLQIKANFRNLLWWSRVTSTIRLAINLYFLYTYFLTMSQVAVLHQVRATCRLELNILEAPCTLERFSHNFLKNIFDPKLFSFSSSQRTAVLISPITNYLIYGSVRLYFFNLQYVYPSYVKKYNFLFWNSYAYLTW